MDIIQYKNDPLLILSLLNHYISVVYGVNFIFR